MQPTLKVISITAIITFVLTSIGWWFGTQRRDQPTKEWHVVKTDPEVKNSPKETIHPAAGLQVYTGDIKSKLKLDTTIGNTDSLQVLDATVLEPDPSHGTDIAVVYDEKTGAVQTLAREEPYPLLKAEDNGYVSASFGWKNGKNQVLRFAGGADLLQIKAIHLGVNGSADTDGTWFVGLGATYRW